MKNYVLLITLLVPTFCGRAHSAENDREALLSRITATMKDFAIRLDILDKGANYAKSDLQNLSAKMQPISERLQKLGDYYHVLMREIEDHFQSLANNNSASNRVDSFVAIVEQRLDHFEIVVRELKSEFAGLRETVEINTNEINQLKRDVLALQRQIENGNVNDKTRPNTQVSRQPYRNSGYASTTYTQSDNVYPQSNSVYMVSYQLGRLCRQRTPFMSQVNMAGPDGAVYFGDAYLDCQSRVVFHAKYRVN